MEFVQHNQKLVSTISIATIVLVVVFNILYFIFAPIQSQGDPANFVATPRLESSAQASASSTIEVPQRSPVSIVSSSILLVIVLLLIVIVLAVVKYKDSQRRERDNKRKQDLARLAQAFEAYRQEHGQYPLSATYLPQYYTGVNLSNDWNYYGLPNKEHMVRYLPDWPISDPAIDYQAKQQVNQYIYYPKENGQKFSLYAHLEEPKKDEQVNYNKQDNLLRSWGAYNYRVSSGQEQPSAVQQIPHPDHAKPTTPASPAGLAVPNGQQPTVTPASNSTPQSATTPPSLPIPSAPVEELVQPAAPMQSPATEPTPPASSTPTANPAPVATEAPTHPATPTIAPIPGQQQTATAPAPVQPLPTAEDHATSTPPPAAPPESVIAAMPPAEQPLATTSQEESSDLQPDPNRPT